MSAEPKPTQAAMKRAETAARLLIERQYDRSNWDDRAFDRCFEMYDGDLVVAALRAMANDDPAVRRAIEDGGYGYFLRRDYFEWHAAQKATAAGTSAGDA